MRVAQIQPTLPEGVTIVPFYDRTDLIRSTITTVARNLAEDADYLIDDQPRHFENFRGRPLLFTAPHNALERRYTRVNSWREVRDFFARLK